VNPIKELKKQNLKNLTKDYSFVVTKKNSKQSKTDDKLIENFKENVQND
jgi:hypothetical protein